MVNNNKRALLWLLIPVVLLLYSGLYYHSQGELSVFFAVPLYAIINIIVAIVFAYYFVQSKTDNRKKKEIVESIINKTVDLIENPKMRTISVDKAGGEADVNNIMIIQRRVFNRLALLSEYQNALKFEKNLTHAQENFQAYWDIISEHKNDYVHLNKTGKDLHRYLAVVADSLERIVVEMHK